jgi:hypothetical protein
VTVTDLFTELFDDAAMFPPGNASVAEAVRGHVAHHLSWYADLVGPLVANTGRLRALDVGLGELDGSSIGVSVVVTDGLDAIAASLDTVGRCDRLGLRAVEVPLGAHRLLDALRLLEPVLADGVACYLEIPVSRVTEQQVHEVRAAGLCLKLRTGGTTVEAFRSEAELARPIVMCAAERLQFKCTAGLHNAVRHRDPDTLFEHHGFLNIALAARVAANTGNEGAVRDTLAERDPDVIGERTRSLTGADIIATRALFGSFGTCSIAEPLDDLMALGLLAVP